MHENAHGEIPSQCGREGPGRRAQVIGEFSELIRRSSTVARGVPAVPWNRAQLKRRAQILRRNGLIIKLITLSSCMNNPL